MGLDLSAILAARACGSGNSSGSGGADGKNAYIRFSSASDGTGMTSVWSEGQNYVGFTTARSAPSSPTELIWCRFTGDAIWTPGALAALLDCFDHAAWIGATDGADCVGALRSALGLPEAGSGDD